MGRARDPSSIRDARAAATNRGPRRLPIWTGATIAVAYIAIAIVQVAGSWTGPLESVVRSSFAQRWNLFAPSPPSANLATFLIVRFDDGSDVQFSAPIDLSTAVRHNSRSQRFAPPRLVRVVTKLNVAFEEHAYEEARALTGRRHLPHTSGRRRADDLESYRRMLSAAAVDAAPSGSKVVAVRGVVTRIPVLDFDRRDETPVAAIPVIVDPDAAPPRVSPDVIADVRGEIEPHPMLIFDSGWMPYAHGIGGMKVELL